MRLGERLHAAPLPSELIPRHELQIKPILCNQPQSIAISRKQPHLRNQPVLDGEMHVTLGPLPRLRLRRERSEPTSARAHTREAKGWPPNRHLHSPTAPHPPTTPACPPPHARMPPPTPACPPPPPIHLGGEALRVRIDRGRVRRLLELSRHGRRPSGRARAVLVGQPIGQREAGVGALGQPTARL